MSKPGYLDLLSTGELQRRVDTSERMLHACVLCGWGCGIDRVVELGPCRTGVETRVATAYLHFGEEKPLVGRGGSGAIFFSNCDLRCQFCQTSRWNIQGQGRLVDADTLAGIMLGLQAQGAETINLVTPTHMAPQILRTVLIAADRGLRLPLVWNSGGYDAPQTLALLDGVVDIYLPDMKYSDPDLARRFSGVHDYPRVNQDAVREMHRQVGDLQVDDRGVATRGLLVRHLVMPGQAENTSGVLKWIAGNLGPGTYLSLMDQYRPAYRAFVRDDLSRPMSPDEYQSARDQAIALGLERLDGSLVLADTARLDDPRSA